MTQRRLKIKLLIVQLIAIVPFLIFIFYLFDLWFDTRRTQALDQNVTKAQLVAGLIDDALERGLTISNILSTDNIFLKNLRTDVSSARRTLLNIISKASDIDNILVADVNGKTVTTTLELSEDKSSVSLFDRDYFQEVLKTKKPVISNPLTGRITGKYLVIIASPVITDNEVASVVLTTYSLENLKNKIEKTIKKNGKTLIVLDKERKIVFTLHQPFPSESEKMLLSDSDFIKKAQNGKTVLVENKIIPPTSLPSLGSSVPVDGLGWTVVSSEPINEIFAPLFKVQSLIWIIIISALLFSLTLVSYFLRKVRVVF